MARDLARRLARAERETGLGGQCEFGICVIIMQEVERRVARARAKVAALERGENIDTSMDWVPLPQTAADLPRTCAACVPGGRREPVPPSFFRASARERSLPR